MYSQFFVLSLRGDPILFRDFRSEFPGADTQSTQLFFQNIQSDAPVFNVNGTQFIYMRFNTLYFVLNTRENISPFVSFETLERIISIFTDFCGILSETTIKQNLLLIYEIVDEMIDFGYVQESSVEPLIALMTNTPVADNIEKVEVKSFSVGQPTPPKTDNFSVAIPLEQGVMFVTLIENIEVLFDGTGNIRKANLEGQLVVRNFTQVQKEPSNPKVQITFNSDFAVGRNNDAASQGKVLDYCTFHECVSFSKWDAQRMLEFKCPSGTFTLMKYLVIDDFAKPFTFSTLVEEGPFDGQLEMVIKITSLLEEGQRAANVILVCPIPKSTVSVSFSIGEPAQQECEYNKSEKKIKWKLGSMRKGSESSIRVKLNLGQEKGNHKRELGPLSLSFEIVNFIYANVAIKSFVIDNGSNPTPQKWIKLRTKSQSYESRVDFSHSNRSRVK